MSSRIVEIVMLAVALIVVGVIYPIGIGLVATAGNTVVNASVPVNVSGRLLSDVADPSVVTLLTVLIPIIAVVVVVLLFLKMRKSN